MALPINIFELLNGKTVEWERIEFRKGWNPERTLRTICAFANDFNNWGGGYIIIGIDEKNSLPVLPPMGVNLNQIDSIQKELNQICRKIIPNYFPIVEPVDFQNKKILVIWCPGGSIRPYKAPESLDKNSRYFYYIRRYSSTVHPTIDEERELLQMANQIPFDDQVNHRSQLNDFDLSTIKIFLNEIGSDLESELTSLSFGDIARRMNIAEGGNENLIPKNVGLLFFAKNSHSFFPSAKIEIVTFDDEAGSTYTEKIFTGGLHRQLKSALDHLKDIVVKEKVIKSRNKAEADRFYNYPYDALEEALCNAVYHRGYDNDSPIEVRIYPSRIDIISFPGPLPPLDKEKLKNNQFEVRKYRNRRIGEFLKELHLTEGRATGIPTIVKALQNNKSPKAIFETDDDRTYFKTSFKIHQQFLPSKTDIESKNELSWHQAGTKLNLNLDADKLHSLFSDNLNLNLGQFLKIVPSVSQVCPKSMNPYDVTIILLMTIEYINLKTLMEQLNQTNRTRFREKYINPLLKSGLLQYQMPEKPRSSKQKYVTTDKGKELLKLK